MNNFIKRYFQLNFFRFLIAISLFHQLFVPFTTSGMAVPMVLNKIMFEVLQRWATHNASTWLTISNFTATSNALSAITQIGGTNYAHLFQQAMNDLQRAKISNEFVQHTISDHLEMSISLHHNTDFNQQFIDFVQQKTIGNQEIDNVLPVFSAQTADSRLRVVVGFKQTDPRALKADLASYDYQKRQLFEQLYPAQAHAEYKNAIECFLETNSEDKARRALARLSLVHLEFHGNKQGIFEKIAQELQCYYFTTEGNLDYRVGRTNVPQELINQLIHELIKDPAYQDFAAYLNDPRMQLFNPQDYDVTCHAGKILRSAPFKNSIIENNYNKQLINFIRACNKGDFKTAQKIKDWVMQQALVHINTDKGRAISSTNNIIQYIWQQYYGEIYDTNTDLYKPGLSDPLFKNMSGNDRECLNADPDYRQQFNDLLIFRHALKKKLQQAWHISDDAPQQVQLILYELLDNQNTSNTPLLMFEKLQSIMIRENQINNKILLDAFFLPNGAVKDFAHYPHVQRLHLPEKILTEHYATTRTILNKLLYLEHVHGISPPGVAATQALTYLEKSLKESDASKAVIYQQLYQDIYQAIQANKCDALNQIVEDSLRKHDIGCIQSIPEFKDFGCATTQLNLNKELEKNCGQDNTKFLPPDKPCTTSQTLTIAKQQESEANNTQLIPPQQPPRCNAQAQTLPSFENATDKKVTLRDPKCTISPDEAKIIWDNSAELKALEKRIQEIMPNVSKERVESYFKENIDSIEYARLEKIAINLYSEITKSVDDVDKIACNTGIDKQIIQKIKNHVFLDEHMVDNKISKFDPDFDIGKIWERLEKNTFVKSDLTWLLHEYCESQLMHNNCIPWRIAHDITNTKYDWDSVVKY